MTKQNSELIKGFKDYIGVEAEKRAIIQRILIDTFREFGFDPAETPVIESEDFVKGDNTDDEAVSDIFKLKDRGKRKLALRYEMTFSLKRIMKNQKLPYRRYAVGPVFRDEPVKGNRSRQFISCDVDVLGSTVKEEAEVFALIKTLLQKLGVEYILYFNNRKLLNEILESLKIKKKYWEDVIREIDKLDKVSRSEVTEGLKKYKAERFLDEIIQPTGYFKKYKAYSEILELKKCLAMQGVVGIFTPFLARGLSYYNGTVFEVKAKKIKETIFGGGSYIFNNVQGVGFGTSIERLSAVCSLVSLVDKYLIVSLNEDKQSIILARKLRSSGKSAVIYYGKPSKAMAYANSYGVQKVIFVGAQEVKKKSFKVKDMKTGKEKILTLEKRTKKNIMIQKK